MRQIEVSAVVMRGADGRVLNVRKRGTRMFMLPGGKPERSETPRDTALREFREELGADLDPTRLTSVGTFRAAAANEPGFEVLAHVFEHPLVAPLSTGAEIDELEWVDPSAESVAARSDLAPLNTEIVFPLLRTRH